MDRLWAPWRMAYILAGDEVADTCIFCQFPSLGPARFRTHGILCATDRAFAMMNKYPYNNGHIMVIPRAHVADPAELSSEDYQATCELLRQATAAVRGALGAHGFNLGMNLGRVAGAGIDLHCHYHVVPRWNGDTNFMPVVGDVKVLSEAVGATYERLLPHFASLGVGPSPEEPGAL
ncbi:MAG: HIT domain-containing protein [Myxococcales bacterium]|nr:HIT domain-containing protein [Myxococcales bacterium]